MTHEVLEGNTDVDPTTSGPGPARPLAGAEPGPVSATAPRSVAADPDPALFSPEDGVVDLGELRRADLLPPPPPAAPLRERVRRLRWRPIALVTVLLIVVAAIAWPAGQHSARIHDLQATRAKPPVLAWIDEGGPAEDSTTSAPHESATLYLANLMTTPVVITEVTSRTSAGRATATLFSQTPVTVQPGATAQTAIDIRATCDVTYVGSTLHVTLQLPAAGGLPSRTVDVPALGDTTLGSDYSGVLNDLCANPTNNLQAVNGVGVTTTSDTKGVTLVLHNIATSIRNVDFDLQGDTTLISMTAHPEPAWTLQAGSSLTVRIDVRATRCEHSDQPPDLNTAALIEVSRPDQQVNEPYIDDLSSAFAAAIGAATVRACE